MEGGWATGELGGASTLALAINLTGMVAGIVICVVRFSGSMRCVNYKMLWLIWLVALCGALAAMQAALVHSYQEM